MQIIITFISNISKDYISYTNLLEVHHKKALNLKYFLNSPKKFNTSINY